MILHYIMSDKKTVRAATITFNGEVQKNCQLANDEKGYITRRKFKDGLIDGTETVHGVVDITIPAGVKGGPYKTGVSNGPERS